MTYIEGWMRKSCKCYNIKTHLGPFPVHPWIYVIHLHSIYRITRVHEVWLNPYEMLAVDIHRFFEYRYSIDHILLVLPI